MLFDHETARRASVIHAQSRIVIAIDFRAAFCDIHRTMSRPRYHPTFPALALAALFAVPGTSFSGVKFKALPLIDYNSDVGMGYGLHTSLIAYSPADSLNHLLRIDAEFYATTGGVLAPYLLFDIPLGSDRSSPRARLNGRIAYERSQYAGYYGFGNDDTQMGYDDSRAQEHYYSYKRTAPVLQANGQYSLWRRAQRPAKLDLLAGIALEYCVIEHSPKTPRTTQPLLFEQQPWGIDGGFTHAEMLGLVYDSRDYHYNPHRGMYHELTVEGSLEALGSDYTFLKATMISAGYLTPLPTFKRMVWAGRLLLVHLGGEPPFYEYERIGGLTPHEMIGGRGTMRGIPAYRYKGRAAAVLTPELRLRVVDFPFLFRSMWHIELVGFSDIGNTWSSWTRVTTDLHATAGAGLRIAWGEDFIVAGDFAFWRGSLSGIYIYFGQQF